MVQVAQKKTYVYGKVYQDRLAVVVELHEGCN